MCLLKRKYFSGLSLLVLVFLFSAFAQAQTTTFSYSSEIEMGDATEPPKIAGLPKIDYPSAARKNRVEGRFKASMTLGADGKARDVVILENLPHGVGEAVTDALQKINFEPAKKDGQPVAVKMIFYYIATIGYEEGDQNVTKPIILEKPEPIYPKKYRAEKLEGKVRLGVMFYPNGKLQIMNIQTVMPKEFENAAKEAAAKIKFEPAVHNKSKRTVAQALTVEYEFKP